MDDTTWGPGALELTGGRPVPYGSAGTLLQFSSTFCAPCRATRRVLDRVVATDPTVTHVELDVADLPVLAERLGVRETPTVLVLDATGTEVTRATGVPTLAQARAAVEAARRVSAR